MTANQCCGFALVSMRIRIQLFISAKADPDGGGVSKNQSESIRIWILVRLYSHKKLNFYIKNVFKGQFHEIFDFRFSTWISFPQAPDYNTRAVSNFFENSRRYSQLKVHHRQIEKIFNQKNFHYFFLTPLGSYRKFFFL
jgi:hypothetical protein